ncbi:MAG: YceI family protein, partial [Saprospiraceae bacterium]|nr:YceI family protein [Saprospiraceae bacterium]
LKSDDFFGVAQFPEAKLDITKVISRGKPGEYKVVAKITIKNMTKEVKFDAMVANGKATATIKLDRTDFDVRYGSGSFFDNLGDKTIYDEFDLTVSLVY